MPGEKITPHLDDLLVSAPDMICVGALVNTDDGASSGARNYTRNDARDSARDDALVDTRYGARDSASYGARNYTRNDARDSARDGGYRSSVYSARDGGYRSSVSSASRSNRNDYSTYYARVRNRDRDRNNYHSSAYYNNSNRYYYNEHDTDPYGGLPLFPTSQE